MDWALGGACFKQFEEVEESGKFEEWVMSLVKVKTDALTDLVRPTKETMLPWVSVRKSNIPNSGWGLFAEKTFKPGDIITVFCGRVFRGNKRDDTLVSFRRSNGTVVYLDTRPQRGKRLFYFGAHLANDPSWGMSEEGKKHLETA